MRKTECRQMRFASMKYTMWRRRDVFMKSPITFAVFLAVSLLAVAQEDFESVDEPFDADANEIRKSINSVGSAEKYLKSVAKVLSQQSPKRLNESTSLIGSSADGMHLILMYKLHKVQSSSDFSGEAKRLQRYTTREICNSIYGKVLITEFNVTYRYIYFSNSQKNLLAFEIDKTSCAEILQSYERPTKKK